MRSEQFKNRPSQLRGTKEKSPGKNHSWDRVIYMVILGSLILVALYLLFQAYFFVSGEGHIVGTHLDVRFPVDIKVTDVYVEAGQQISEEDSLFTYSFIEQRKTVSQLQKEQEELQEELLDLRSDIELMGAERQELREKIAFYQKRQSLLEKEVKLDIEPINSLNTVSSKLVELNSDLRVLQKEMDLVSARAGRMEQNSREIYRTVRSEELQYRESPGTQETYFAPVQGRVNQVLKKSSELAFRSEPLISIRIREPQVRIKAIFNEQSIKHLAIADEVKVTFDNGEESTGKIVDIQAITDGDSNLMDITELSDRYVVEVMPVDDEAREVWESLSHLGVTVTKSIYSL